MSSWGDRGYNEVWINETNDYTCRHILKAAERMIYLAEKFPRSRGRAEKSAQSGCTGSIVVSAQRLDVYYEFRYSKRICNKTV